MNLLPVITGGMNHRTQGGGATGVVANSTLVQELMKAACYQGFKKGKLVRVVVIEGRPVHGRSFRDVLHGNLVEALCLHEGSQGPLEELSSAAHPRIANFTV